MNLHHKSSLTEFLFSFKAQHVLQEGMSNVAHRETILHAINKTDFDNSGNMPNVAQINRLSVS